MKIDGGRVYEWAMGIVIVTLPGSAALAAAIKMLRWALS